MELERMGVTKEVVQILEKVNRSLVKLTPKDEMDESDHRMVILNSDNSLNKNLAK